MKHVMFALLTAPDQATSLLGFNERRRINRRAYSRSVGIDFFAAYR